MIKELSKGLLNVELADFQVQILEELNKVQFPMLLMPEGSGKNYLLAVHSILRCIFNPGYKVCFTAAGFRQSKSLLELTESILYKSLLKFKIRKQADYSDITIGDSNITAMSLGNSERVRGYRANCLIAVDFANIDQEVFEEAIAGFAVVNTKRSETQIIISDYSDVMNNHVEKYKKHYNNVSFPNKKLYSVIETIHDV